MDGDRSTQPRGGSPQPVGTPPVQPAVDPQAVDWRGAEALGGDQPPAQTPAPALETCRCAALDEPDQEASSSSTASSSHRTTGPELSQSFLESTATEATERCAAASFRETTESTAQVDVQAEDPLHVAVHDGVPDIHCAWDHRQLGVGASHGAPLASSSAPLRIRLSRDQEQEQELQARSMRQERRDARVFAAFLALKALCYFLAVLAMGACFAFFAMQSTNNYIVFYLIWSVMGLATLVLTMAKTAFMEALEQWNNTTRVHIVLRSHDNGGEFKAVGKYLENCGIMCPHMRLRVYQDEDDVEEVRFCYTPWARSFVKRACVYGDTGEVSSLKFRAFCPGRFLPGCLARCCPGTCHSCGVGTHGHLEVRYRKDDDWEPGGHSGAGDSITFSVEDHHAQAIQNLILRAHSEATRPRTTKVEVYSATSQQGGAGGAPTLASWEFMQYISPLAQERTGRFTYVPSHAFAQIEEEYRRVVTIGNESLTVLVTGASRAGKSAMVTALAHRLGVPVYSLNLKAKFLLDGGVDTLFSHRAIPHRPVLVHIEEFSMMFQETVSGDAEWGGHYEGLQSSSALNCSDLLKLFDQSGTTSPKRILFVLTCIELPRHFDRVPELRPLLAKGRITHFELEDPSPEVISQYLLQYFYPEARRGTLSEAEKRHLETYHLQMKAKLDEDYPNWHSVKKYAETNPLSRLRS